MSNLQTIVWLFPILFIFHDFEEIIFLRAWVGKNKPYLMKSFPGLSQKMLPHLEGITTSGFALGVGEEFILITTITIISFVMNWYDLWIGTFIAFTFHLLIHCLQALLIRKYVPCIVTSVICLPICLVMIFQVMPFFTLNTIIIYSLLGMAIVLVNIIALHLVMAAFSKWISKYEH